MNNSILDNVKKSLGIAEDYTAFDIDLILSINTVFSTLHQLGIGPTDGFEITDNSLTWDAFIDNATLNSVKSYVILRVRLLFDPPTTSFGIDAAKEQMRELEWRLNVVREFSLAGIETVDPFSVDGGTP